jgi:hypothetical protein
MKWFDRVCGECDRLSERAGDEGRSRPPNTRAAPRPPSVASLIDGRPTFAVACRLEDAQGQSRGAVLALIEDAFFRNFYEQIDLGSGTAIRLLRTDGTPVVVFENRPADRPSKRLRSALRPVPGFPLRVEVTRDEAVTLATWRTSPIDELIGAGALSLFVAVLAFALVRQVRRLRQINRRLQSSQQQYPRADPQVAPDRVVPPDTLRGQCGAY